MSEIATLMMALFAGILLGGVFYGGLWWTVRRSVLFKNQGLWLIGSFVLRAIVAVSGFYFASQSDWRSLPVCLLGFLMARIVVTWLTRIPRATDMRFIDRTGP